MIIDDKNFDFNKTTELCQIMNKHGSDKGNGRHNYTLIYDFLFYNMKKDYLNIFELGLGTNNIDVPSNMGKDGKPGASLYGWKEYFINSRIYGADVDRRILFQTGGIETFYCDQTSPEDIKKLWSNLQNVQFDIIIEDGLHSFDANICFLENSFFKLKKDGFYVIEDITISDYNKFIHYMNGTRSINLEIDKWQIVNLPNEKNNYDNILLIIKK